MMPYVYIMSSPNNNVLYTGVTNDLVRRIYEHKNDMIDGFTKRYHVHKLVYYEIFEDIENAIIREKKIKNLSRDKKEILINEFNTSWIDLYSDVCK